MRASSCSTGAGSTAARCCRIASRRSPSRPSAGGLTLASSASPEDLKLLADERAFRQIVGNLLSNAIKFTPPGGKIAVRLTLVDEGAMLSIRDTGCGIPADQLPVIFQPFEQIGRRYGRANGGTGLGLDAGALADRSAWRHLPRSTAKSTWERW